MDGVYNYRYLIMNILPVPLYHLPTPDGNVSTAPCDVVDLTCEELGAVSPSVTGIV